MAAKVTLKEIAQEVGLSPSAVSLVLNDRPCRISEENRKRIKEVAARKRYVPNQIARSLVMQQSRTFGLIVPNIESRFFSSLARNLEVRCRERGYALFIMNSDVSSEHEEEIVRLLVNRGVDGLMLVTAHEIDADEQLVESLASLPVPLVMVDRFIEGVSCDRVRFDSELGGFLATDCLLQQGHTRIACLVNTLHTPATRALRDIGVHWSPTVFPWMIPWCSRATTISPTVRRQRSGCSAPMRRRSLRVRTTLLLER
mgnify:CR=1 FL=1